MERGSTGRRMWVDDLVGFAAVVSEWERIEVGWLGSVVYVKRGTIALGV